jgi:hypothetical protein
MIRSTTSLRTLVIGIVLWLWAFGVPAAHAHDGAPRLDLGAERLAPGATLEVRGINIAPEMQVTLALVGGGAEFPLGVVIGDEHGDFVQAVVVPREAIAGAYSVRAFGANRVVVAAPITIAGTAIEEQGEQRAEEEPLLIPLPQRQPAPVQSIGGAATAAPATPVASARPTLPPAALIAFGALLAAGLALALVARSRALRAGR